MSSHLLFVVPGSRLPDFSELSQAWRDVSVRVTVRVYDGALPDAQRMLDDAAGRVDAVLLAGSSRHAPSTTLPGPFLDGGAAGRIPCAWLPLRAPETNRRFAAAAARVHRRGRQKIAIALLGQWHPRYLRVTDRVESMLAGHVDTVRWTADVIERDQMVRGLRHGLGLGLYLGHGRPVGWVGYRGMRGHHFDEHAGEPLGALFSLCCRTASRRRVGLSYAEAVPLMGVAAASFGAISDTLHTDNTRWALGLCDALVAGAKTVGELVVRAAPASLAACTPYRLIGDPLAPIASTRRALARSRAVATYA